MVLVSVFAFYLVFFAGLGNADSDSQDCKTVISQLSEFAPLSIAGQRFMREQSNRPMPGFRYRFPANQDGVPERIVFSDLRDYRVAAKDSAFLNGKNGKGLLRRMINGRLLTEDTIPQYAEAYQKGLPVEGAFLGKGPRRIYHGVKSPKELRDHLDQVVRNGEVRPGEINNRKYLEFSSGEKDQREVWRMFISNSETDRGRVTAIEPICGPHTVEFPGMKQIAKVVPQPPKRNLSVRERMAEFRSGQAPADPLDDPKKMQEIVSQVRSMVKMGIRCD